MPYDWTQVRHELNEPGRFESITNSPWHSDADYERFSDAEYARRHALAREFMARDGFAALLLTGSPSISSCGGAVTWGSGLRDGRGSFQYLLLPASGEPTLFYPHTGSHVEAVRRMVCIGDVRSPHGRQVGELIADRLRELDIRSGRVGVTATDRGQEYLGALTGRSIGRELPDVELVYCPDLLHELTYRKSEEELAAMRRGGELAVAGLRAMAAAAVPGRREYQLAAAATAAMLDGGGEPHLVMIGSTAAADPRMVYPNPNPSGRVLRSGDVILGELAARYLGYSAKIGHPVTIGPAPQTVVEFHRKARDILAEMAAHLRVGTDLGDLQRTARSAFERAGVQARPLVAHGIDLITSEPRVLIDKVSATGFDRVLVDGMVMNITITPISPDGTFGVFLSRTYAVGQAGTTCLTPFPVDDVWAAG